MIATKRAVLALALYDEGLLQLDGSASGESLAGSVRPYDASFNNFFARINPIALTSTPDIDNITILGDLLTLEEISSPVSNLLLYNSTNYVANDTVRFVRGNVPPSSDGSDLKDVIVSQWDNYGVFIDKSVNPITKVLLQLNGHDRFSERDGNYFNYVQPYQHHSNTPTDGLNLYSFSLNPEDHQPSGTCNMSRIDNATLNLQFGGVVNSGGNPIDFKLNYLADDSIISIFATNYNVLRIMSGMGGLAYSN